MAQNYREPNRLQEVLQLIQITARRRDFQSETRSMDKEFPRAILGESWITVAQEHPEFFRVAGVNNSISLVARYYPEGESRHPLSFDETRKWLDFALLLHERQVKAKERTTAQDDLRTKHRQVIASIIGVILTGLLGILASLMER